MIRILFIPILLLLNLYSFASHITKDGYGDFLFGKTSLAYINEMYPEKDRALYDLGNNEKMVSINFPEQGVEIFFIYKIADDLNNVFLSQINITAPCTGTTEKNIGIGSSIENVLMAYPQKSINPKGYKKGQLVIYDSFQIFTSKGKVDSIMITPGID